MSTLKLNFTDLWNTWNPKQARFSSWQGRPGVLSTKAFLGSWGLGKTEGAARDFLWVCMQNSWHSGYGNDQPRAYIVAPTNPVLHQATIPKFMKMVPKQLVAKRVTSSPAYMDLINGVQIRFVSAESTFEGVDAFCIWIDEISAPIFSKKTGIYENIYGRLRDGQAPIRRILVSGLPLSGWVREQFDFSPKDPDHFVVRGGMNDNYCLGAWNAEKKIKPFIPPDVRENLLRICPAGQEEMLVNGAWGQPIGATYPMFSSDTHLVNSRGDPRAPVCLGIDVGQHGAIVVAQRVRMPAKDVTGREFMQDGVLIVDEILTEHESLEQAIYRFKIETNWVVEPGRSVVCLDPTVRRDEENVVASHLPGVDIVMRRRTDDLYSVHNSIRFVQAALKDALGNTRIKIWEGLSGKRFGIVEALQVARGNPQTGLLQIKDDSRDHVLDGFRYLACELLQPPAVKPRYISL